ncbi:beta-1,4-galactosyltransferase galt-1-like [Ruditapes philippinarum]|uniref:beta-1,4-galactosyltransferase galt-1-like n=1 Tax=Ruditapes philippinarum TaxID=129788 RepID=UPI00295AB545|nr:beta-1,4-galactosyltransferase galt-1-like [Ruditapes philippinarum]
MPLVHNNALDDKDLRHVINNSTPKISNQDLYKLNWNEKDKMFFKKVRNIIEKSEIVDHHSTSDSIDCDSTTTNKFWRISAGIYVYSAYFDTRNETAYIRMIAAVSKEINKVYLNTTLSCVFNTTEDGENSSATSVVYSPLQSYEMCENHKRLFGGWMFSCQVPKNLKSKPLKIQLKFLDLDNITKSTLKDICITSRHKNIKRRKLNFGVCVPPLYGEIKAKSLIEFIEFNRVLGAEIFILYIENSIDNLSMEVRSVIRYYERQNVIIFHPWRLPFTSESIWYHGQSLAINDCLYRNMDDFKYLVFIDLDEFIIPQNELITWTDVINRVKENDPEMFKRSIGMSFKSTFFSEEFSRHVFSNEMSMTVRTNRTRNFSFRRNKVLVQPEKIFELGIHHVSKPLHEKDSQNIINIPTSVAHIHHYRSCVNEFGIHCKIRVEDYTVPYKYGQQIIDNYLKIVFDITP